MSKVCPKCGKTLVDDTTVCLFCGAPISATSKAKEVFSNSYTKIKKTNFNSNPVSLAALVLSGVLFFLCIFTAFVDSSSYINRLYTTALAWSLPLFALGLIVFSFYDNCKKGLSNIISWISVALIVLAFGFSNITKNSVQDIISNADNLVDVATEAIRDNGEEVEDWEDDFEDAVSDVERELNRNRKSNRYEEEYYGY